MSALLMSPSQRERPLNKDELVACGECCRLLFQETGLGSALTYLFALLREHIPLTRIFCGFRQYRFSTFTPMADTVPGLPHRIRTLATGYLSEHQFRQLMGTDDGSSCSIDNAFHFAPSPGEPDPSLEDVASYLRILLFNIEESAFHMIFCAAEPGTFSAALAGQLQVLTGPLGEALHESFIRSGTLNPAEPFRIGISASERLARCSGLRELCQLIDQAAATDCTVLVLGETGTGKEIVADAIAESSVRRDKPFIKINCGAFNEQLVDSELFGHEKGAFTGAYGPHAGYFEAAHGGTLFLDEIGDLPLSIQARLLRVLDRREILRVGSSRALPLDVRVIAATHRDLPAMVRQGTFRRDLWYRLNVLTLRVPPLREHRTDIPGLAQFFINIKSRQWGIVPPPVIAPEQTEALCRYHWPGNIRELEHLLERSLVGARIGTTPFAQTLERELQQARAAAAVTDPLADTATFSGRPCSGLAACPRQPELSATAGWEAKLRPALHALLSASSWPSLKEVNEAYIQDVMTKTGGKVSGPGGAAALLGVHPNTLHARRHKPSKDYPKK